MSLPLAEAVYWTEKVPVFDPAAGEIGLPRADVSDQELAFVTEMVSVTTAPCCTEDGPLIEADAPDAMLRTAAASSPAPQAFTARAE